jgi:hypothetical protein
MFDSRRARPFFCWQHPHVHSIATGELQKTCVHLSKPSASYLTGGETLAGSYVLVMVQSRKKLNTVGDAATYQRNTY